MKLTACVISSLLLLGLSSFAAPGFKGSGDADSALFFENRVRPLLAENCFACHGPQIQKSRLRLDSRSAVVKGGARGPALIPGRPESSLLVKAIHRAGELKMPPDRPLTESQVRVLTEWIRSGAKWPESAKPIRSDGTWWSFEPVKRQKLTVKSPIDHYINQALRSRGLKPSPLADRRTLVRRAYFDLIGLPPSPEQLRSHLSDPSGQWYEKMIDALLASPHYGERWARRWLDVARYADSLDSRGLGSEGDIAFAWRYRDWVVNGLNRDMPYPEFIANQIAGDLLPAEKPGDFNRAGTIATGFLAIGNWGNGDADKDKILTDIADDQVDVVSRAFLGLTIACARCHDHKFDPITQRDYYAMAGIFFSTHILAKLTPKGEGEKPMRIPLESRADQERRTRHAAQVKESEEKLKALVDGTYTRHAESLMPIAGKYISAVREFRRLADSGVTTAAFSAQNGLQDYALRQWIDLLAPGRFRVMETFMRDVLNSPGVFAWKGQGDTPSLTINTNADARSLLTFTLPPRSVAIHPGPSSGVAVAWRAPSAGSVKVQGRLADADPVGGDGILWSLVSLSGVQETEVVKGDIPNGGQAQIPDSSLKVNPGDELQLRVLPKANHGFDTTTVELIITNSDSGTLYDLTRDVLDKPESPAPGYWRFLELDPPKTDLSGPWDAVAAEFNQSNGSAGSVEKAVEVFGKTFTAKNPRNPFRIRNPEDESALEPGARDALSKQRFDLANLKRSTPPPVEYTNGALEGGVPESPHAGIHDVKIHLRGSYEKLGDTVARGFPSILAGQNPPAIQSGSGRLELARWIGSPNHPLTARVMANRIWQGHFGEGIVRTPGNFGRLGEKPTVPGLLDYLASSFIKSGWSMKCLHREIMLSEAYRRLSEASPEAMRKDPDNRLFGRQNRRRLDAESFRDAMLFVSGELDRTAGGPAIRDINTKRRTLYVMSIRSDRTGYGPLFDMPDSTNIVDQRTVSTVAPQALYMLNNPFVLDRSAALAARILSEQAVGSESVRQRIRKLYLLLYGRQPQESEIRIGESILNDATNSVAGAATRTEQQRWTEYCQILLASNEFMIVD